MLNEGSSQWRVTGDGVFSHNRRAFLGRSAGALVPWRCAHLLADDCRPAPAEPTRKTKAKSVICLFQHGGPSQVDLFDPKPELTRWDKKPYPGSLEVHFNKQQGNLLASPFAFRPRGRSGHRALRAAAATRPGIADEITLVRSMTTESVDHESALRLIHSGKFQAGPADLGLVGDLWTRDREPRMPAYVVLTDPGGPAGRRRAELVVGLVAGRLPGDALPRQAPIRCRTWRCPAEMTHEARAGQLGFLDALNRSHLRQHPGRPSWRRGSRTSRLAARMQTVGARVCSTSRARPRRPAVSTDSTATRPASTAHAACWPGGWSSAGFGSCRSSSAASPGTRTPRTPKSLKTLCAGPTARAPPW